MKTGFHELNPDLARRSESDKEAEGDYTGGDDATATVMAVHAYFGD